jgi:hypothetical protein
MSSFTRKSKPIFPSDKIPENRRLRKKMLAVSQTNPEQDAQPPSRPLRSCSRLPAVIARCAHQDESGGSYATALDCGALPCYWIRVLGAKRVRGACGGRAFCGGGGRKARHTSHSKNCGEPCFKSAKQQPNRVWRA